MATITKTMDSGTTGTVNRRRSHLARYRQVALTLAKYHLRELTRTLGLDHVIPFWWVTPGLPWRKPAYSQPERTRMALEELGTTFIKLGQILSTRTDIIPLEYARELTKLQNAIKPLPLAIVNRVIFQELGRPVEKVFATFDPVPLGVASIGQVHAATLFDGSEVVIKVRKPGVKEQVEEDAEILHQLAVNAAAGWKDAHHYDLVAVIEEVTEALMAEMDYIQEGHNAEYFSRFFQDNPQIHIPRVYWEYTTKQVITLERLRGISLLDTSSLEKSGVDLKDLARRSMNLWQEMVFNGEVFHADPHPGNLFVEKDGRLGLIDFGMVGMVDTEVQENLATAVKAIVDRDVDRLIDSLMDLGAVRVEVSRQNLRIDLKHIMGHYPRFNLAEIQTRFNLGELIKVIRRHQVQLPSNTFLLLKTMSMAQSLAHGLDPDFDILQLLEPDVKRVLDKKSSLHTIAQKLPAAGAELANLGLVLPQRINRLVSTFERGEMRLRADVPGLERHVEHLERIANRIVVGVIVASVVIGTAILILAFKLGH